RQLGESRSLPGHITRERWRRRSPLALARAPPVKSGFQLAETAAFTLRQMASQQAHKLLGQATQFFGLLAGGRLTHQILAKPVPLVAEHFRHPHLTEKCLVREQMDGVIIGTVRVRHQEMTIVADRDELRGAENETILLGLMQTCKGDGAEVSGCCRVPDAAPRISLDV